MADFGLIETIKVVNGRMVFKNLHVRRLYESLKVLNINESEYKLEDRLLRLLKYECVGNGLKNFRLRVEIQKNRAHDYMPEISALKWNCTLRPLESVRYELNTFGFKLTTLPKKYKLLDTFANLKHTDRSIYEAAISYARQHDFDDAVVLNERHLVADASIYNIFVVKDKMIYTPPLTDGPVAGVMRTLLLSRLEKNTITEKSLTLNDLYNADEIFLTNALRGIRWVESINDTFLSNVITQQVFEEFRSVVSEHFGEHLV